MVTVQFKMGSLEVSYLTDIGGRSTNEDRILAKSFDGLHLLAVADGLGGHAAGEIASDMAVTEIEESLQLSVREGDIRNQVKEAVARANRKIYSLARENDKYTGMGTTLVMALIRQARALIANVGDSRAYYLNESQIKQITRDHSVVQELLERGLITEEEAWYHPYRGTLTKALGVEPEVKVDLYDTTFNQGDILMLCSDGLTDSLRNEEIIEVISSAVNLDEACAELVRQAKARDTRDNISVILAREK